MVHYSEVALKGKNRPEFARTLRRNLARALWGLDPEIRSGEGRFIVRANGGAGDISERIGKTFGVAWSSPAVLAGRDYDEIQSAVSGVALRAPARTFKVEARRSDKLFPIRSRDLASRLGAAVVADTGMKVDLSSPDLTIHVDVTRTDSIVYVGKQEGPGGLPVGTAGRVMHLFSGGIDSPVAAWLLMKRGCVPVYLHFYLAPTPESVLGSKIIELLKVLAGYGGKSTLVMVPFAEYQAATMGSPPELEPSLFRRFMRMTAEGLAPEFGASAISTGDSLSQAASQTIWNLAAFDQGATTPILRPLLTYDKEEIIELARRISTYDLSLKPYKDCCDIVTRHPKTRVKPADIDTQVARLGLKDLVRSTLGRATLASYDPSGGALKTSPLEASVPLPPLPRKANL